MNGWERMSTVMVTAALLGVLPAKGGAQLCAGCETVTTPSEGTRHIFQGEDDMKDCTIEPFFEEEEIEEEFWCHYLVWEMGHCDIVHKQSCWETDEEELTVLHADLRVAVRDRKIETIQQLVIDSPNIRTSLASGYVLTVITCAGEEVGRVSVPGDLMDLLLSS